MRIATWNLARCRPGSVRETRIREWVSVIAADVWVFTETYSHISPGGTHRLIAHSADAPDRQATAGECWTAIWSRVPAERVELRADLERTAAARLTDTDMVVIGTVLPWLTDGRRPGERGAKAFCNRLIEQKIDWLRHRNQASGGLCVAGDFNQDLLTVGHYYGSAEGREALKGAFAECGLVCLTGGQHNPLAGPHALACIDHLAVGGVAAAGRSECGVWPTPGSLRATVSDHYGVWADIDLVPATRSPLDGG